MYSNVLCFWQDLILITQNSHDSIILWFWKNNNRCFKTFKGFHNNYFHLNNELDEYSQRRCSQNLPCNISTKASIWTPFTILGNWTTVLHFTQLHHQMLLQSTKPFLTIIIVLLFFKTPWLPTKRSHHLVFTSFHRRCCMLCV